MHGNGVKTDPHGNLFEGEWKEGKPIVKGGQNEGGALDWLNEAVANVTSIGGGGTPRRGEYSSVSTHGMREKPENRTAPAAGTHALDARRHELTHSMPSRRALQMRMMTIGAAGEHSDAAGGASRASTARLAVYLRHRSVPCWPVTVGVRGVRQ